MLSAYNVSSSILRVHDVYELTESAPQSYQGSIVKLSLMGEDAEACVGSLRL
jgi:hypothetical protein